MAKETLESLNTNEEETLGSVLDEGATVSKGHAPSNKNKAAYSSLLTESDPVATYRQIQAEMEEYGRSPTSEMIKEDSKARAYANTKAAFMDFLSDENYSDEQKRTAARNVLDKTNALYNTQNLFSSEALASESPGEPVEQELVRLNLAGTLDKVNDYKRKSQYLLNSEIAKADTDKVGAWLDFIEILLPFDEQARVNNVRNALVSDEDARGELEGLVSFLGSSKYDIKDLLENTSIDQRMELAEKIVQAVNSEDKLIFFGDNELTRYEMLKTFLDEGYYEDSDEFIDNTISVLDAIGVGAAFKRSADTIVSGTKKVFKNASPFADVDFMSAWRRRHATKTAQPVSPAENMVDVNPQKARLMHEATELDEGGEVASAMYGTSREDAIAGDILPEIKTDDGRVRNRTHNPQAIGDQNITPNAEILDVANKDGAIYYFESEKKQMRSIVYNDFENAAGIHMRSEMSQFGDAKDGGVAIRAVYGAKDGGYPSAQRALDLAKFNLRKYGVDERDITILKRNVEGEYVPVKGIPEEPGDYLAQVEYNYKFNPLDVQQWAEADVKYNIFDRIGYGSSQAKSGTLQRTLLDAHSMLHPKLTLGANVSIDKAAGLENQLLDFAKEFSDSYVKLPADRKALLDDYIREANYRGIPMKESRLKSQGYTDGEVEILRKWKGYWDTMYWLENADMAKSLRSRGFQILEDSKGDTRLFARRTSQGVARSVRTAYDPDTGKLVNLTPEQVDELYNNHGTMVQLRSPMQVGDQLIDNVIVKETVEGSRLRGIRDHDKILNYRHGYYTVHYQAPKFIVKRQRDAAGREYTQAVGVAGDTKAAEAYADGLRLNAGEGVEYFVRGDIRKLDMNSDDYWNIQSASGRVAQRARGKRLEDGSDLSVAGDNSFVMGPVDSMIHAARSTGSRVHMRNYIEATKQRFLSQFESVLNKEKGLVQWPRDLDVIRSNAKSLGIDNKIMGDAVTTWEYIRYLEHGYINSIDDGIKASLRAIADIVGSRGMSKAERSLNVAAEGRGVMGLGKNLAFQAYLATNPLRQFVVQAHQGTLLTVNFPKYVLSQRLAKDIGGVLTGLVDGNIKDAAKITGRTPEELSTLIKEFKESGLASSVDKQNLTEGSLTELAENSSKFGNNIASKAAGKSMVYLRKAGFDAGETINVLSAWLAHRNRAVERAGTFKLNQEQLDQVSAEARNYTYNMNFAGDMPYNQNSLNLVFQFFQVPHKALTQMTTNRVLSRKEKVKLAAYQVPMFTLPPAAMYNLFGEQLADLPEEWREALVQGLEGYAFNKMMSLLIDEPSKTDFSSLAPLDMYGTYEFVEALITTDIVKILSESPSGQLIAGNNPRITNAFKDMARYFNVVDDYESSTQFSTVANSFASISSGYSNMMKSRYAYQYGQLVHGMDVVDENVTSMEAIAKAFGFATMDETLYWYQKSQGYEKRKEFEDDVRTWYRDLKAHFNKQGYEPKSEAFIRQTFSEAWRVFSINDKRAREIVLSEMRKDLRDSDGSMVAGLLRNTGWMSQDEIRGMVTAMPNLPEEKKQEIIKILDNMDAQQRLEND